MDKILNYIKVMIMVLGTGITWLLGTWDIVLIVLVSFGFRLWYRIIKSID